MFFFIYTLVDRYFDFGWIDIMIEREQMNHVKGGKTYVPYHLSKSVYVPGIFSESIGYFCAPSFPLFDTPDDGGQPTALVGC